MSDLISRKEAIEAIDAVFPVDPMKSEYAQGIACGAALAKTYVEQLPSAQPERKTGKWIKMSDSDGEYYCCNNCGGELPRYITKVPTWDRPYPPKYSIDRTDFCPNCGCRMREGDSDDER